MRSKYIVFFMVVSQHIFGQYNYQLLKDVIFALPDSIYINNPWNINDIALAWNIFDSINETDSNYQLYQNTPNNKSFTTFKIDTTNHFFSLAGNGEMQVKIYILEGDTSVAVSLTSSNEGEPPQCLQIGFYEFFGSELTNKTNQVLYSFDYPEQNYSRSTVSFLTDYYGSYKHTPYQYIYKILSNGSLIIYDNFYDFYCCEPGNFYLDPSHLEGEFFWRKYSFKNYSLTPIGKVQKKMKAKNPLFH